MKNNLIKSLFFLILLINVVKAQDFHGRAIYVSKQLNNVVFHVEGMSEEKAKELKREKFKKKNCMFTI